MRFDDRLRTVLAQPASLPHDRAVRWRQLVELLARSGADADPGLIAQAMEALRQDSLSVDERVRMAAALAIAALPLSADLVAAFAADRLSVAAPVLASARLTATEWKHVSAHASDECRAFVATMRSDQPSVAGETANSQNHDRPEQHVPSISDVVARIEKLRQSREAEASAESADNGNGEAPRLFRWECNESGEIDWIEGAPRGALVGQSIAQRSVDGGVNRTVERAFASRAPFHEGVLELPREGRLGGTWRISGIPAFERTSGRFAGYRGVAERFAPAPLVPADPDSIRELAHEIKTPLNAIVGFAEIISGEYLGPAESRFRERANDIVAQARLLLAAIDDLDFAAKIHSSTGNGEARAHLGEVCERLAPVLREEASSRRVGLDASRTTADLTAAVEPEVAERLILRLCSAVIARADEGERLRLSVDRSRGHCSVSISRPLAMQGLSSDALFGTADDALSDGFQLRLARGLAQAAGAELTTSAVAISLVFPSA